MAQQLAATRSPAAYAGVTSYAQSHTGEAAAAAYLALAHAYVQDRRFAEASTMYRQAGTTGEALSDYADYLGSQAAVQAGRPTDSYALLDHFADRHPGSIFTAGAPVLLANAFLQQANPQAALALLTPLADTPAGTHADFRSALARAYQLAGDTPHAATLFRSLYASAPFSYEATQARLQLQSMGLPLTAAERKSHADQLFNARRYTEAAEEYHSIAKNDATLSPADRDALAIYAAVCDLKLKHINRKEVEKLPDTTDDSAAAKLYLLSELSRNDNDRAAHDALIAQMLTRFPASRWLEEALYSGGNMYLIKHEVEQEVFHYAALVRLFPRSLYTPSAHWRLAWASYRQRRYGDAARLMQEQIERYSTGIEIPAALYWRARLYEDEEHNFGQAINFYRALDADYVNSYYAHLARQRLSVLAGQPAPDPAASLASIHPPDIPELTDALPENDLHLIKARLLANASLNEYIGPEIQASPTAGQWGALAQAEIYQSYGESSRALQAMKHSGAAFYVLPIDRVPMTYWRLLFPQPYWTDLVADAQRNGLDPYLVASLIRQESEFNPNALSHASAYGLMQLLPSVGKTLAKRVGIKGFTPNALFNPAVNLQLGTLNLRQALDRFGGQPEYALAAYNAGDTPVREWIRSNDYKDIPEFVESIPYTETREYVQAILRNREMYRSLYPAK